MSERYENWKELKPLTEPAIIGTKCACLVDDFCFKAGDVVRVELLKKAKGSFTNVYFCKSEAGELIMFGHELALLPSDS